MKIKWNLNDLIKAIRDNQDFIKFQRGNDIRIY